MHLKQHNYSFVRTYVLTKADQAYIHLLVPLLLPLRDQICISVPILQQPVIQLS